MSTYGFSDKNSRRYRDYTGDGYQHARKVLLASRVFDPLPAASGTQELLEAQVMQYVGAGKAWWAHPLGIAGTRITDNGLLVFLDGRTELSTQKTYPMSAYAAENLLPVAEVGSQVFGAIGLRAHVRSSTDLVVTTIEGDGEVVLRAAGDEDPEEDADWAVTLARRSTDLVDDTALLPLWQQPGMTAHEQGDIASHPLVRQGERSMAWIGSALLRRIALFHTASVAYSTKSWINPGEWIFEMAADSRAEGDHDLMLDQLSADRWGLPVDVVKEHCGCASAARNGSESYQCFFRLGHKGGLPGAVQLRFTRSRLPDRDRMRGLFQRLGSDRTWLDKVLPHDPSARGGAR
ncbi:MAG: hypothetical protein AUG49_05100 [Catenulispora sp. 13_1_20CM_3_70_7]|nr:MAG: hypothetical protein AUG49_05100 [Catenulispora sp. 13_1_20CM_3_70_7]